MAKQTDKPKPKTKNPDVEKAATSMKEADLARQVKEADTDKENLAADAQKMRALLADKDKEITHLTATCTRLSTEGQANSERIPQLEEEIGALRLQLNSIQEADPVFHRSEVGKYAAVIYAGILQAHDRPDTIINEKTAISAVRGAKTLSAALDKEFPGGEKS